MPLFTLIQKIANLVAFIVLKYFLPLLFVHFWQQPVSASSLIPTSFSPAFEPAFVKTRNLILKSVSQFRRRPTTITFYTCNIGTSTEGLFWRSICEISLLFVQVSSSWPLGCISLNFQRFSNGWSYSYILRLISYIWPKSNMSKAFWRISKSHPFW